jgi:beta-carotene 15,15'-dioxygenase
MTTQPRWQTMLFAATVTLAISAAIVIELDLTLQILLLAPLVAVLGLPHGALDLPIAEALWPLDGWRGKLRFALCYLGLAAAVIGLWLLAPGLALAAFLAYSALHFADDWQGAPAPLRWTGGLATVGAPALGHRAEVADLFGYLAPPPAADIAADALAVAGAAALLLLLAALVMARRCRGRTALEQLMLWTAALALAPLVYFVVYFCALHAIRHFTSAITSIDRPGRSIITVVTLSALVVAAATLAAFHLHSTKLVAVDEAVFKVVFIGLAALTVPHMILVHRFHHHQA